MFYYDISNDKNEPLKKRHQAINKSLQFAKEISQDTLLIKTLYQKNFIHFSLRQYDSLLYFGNLLFENADGVKDSLYLGKQHHLLAYYFNEIHFVPDSAFYHYNLSKGYFKNDSSQIGRRLMSMGLIQKNQNDFFGSKETITEALEYLNPKKDTKYISSSYNALATNHRKLLNYPDAIKYYATAIKTTDSEKDKLIYQNNLAATYVDNEQYNDAISLLQQIALDSLLANNKKEYARVLDNLAYAQWRSGKNIRPKDFLEPLKIRQQNNDKRGQIASYTHLGEFYSKTNSTKARLYFDTVIQLSKPLKIPRAEKDALKFLMQLEHENVRLRDRYVFLQDSLYEQELKVKTQFAKYKYDDKLKQESILRLEKETAEKELELQQQRNQKILSYFGGGLLLLLLGFIAYYFRQRTLRLKQLNKTARIEATFETEEELSRKLHDDFGGKLNQTMLLVQNGADKALVLDNLERLYNQSRDFSREINDVDTGPNYKEELLAMLGSRKLQDTKLFTTGLNQLDWSVVPTLTKTTLFKILQELMINMGKHSEARIVAITFQNSGKSLKINYEDDGVGASSEAVRKKNGLRNTEKRIEAINGTIIFDSEKGNGFRAEIEIPK